MSFGPPHAFTTDLHPPPSFWSTSAAKQDPATNTTACDGDRAPYAATSKKGSDVPEWHLLDALPVHREPGSTRAKGAAAANTVCSALRTLEVARRHRRRSPVTATIDLGGDMKRDDQGLGSAEVRGGSAAGGRRRRCRRPQGRSAGASFDERGTRSSVGGVGSAAVVGEGDSTVDVSKNRGRFSPKAAIPPPLPVRECWGDDGGNDGGDDRGDGEGFQSYCPAVASRSSSRGSRRERGDRDRATSSNNSPTRILSWTPLGNERGDHEEEEKRAMSPGPRNEAGQAGGGLFDDVSPPRSPGSSRRGKGVEQGSGDPETGAAFLKIQRDLLEQLERLFVTIADDRRHTLVALKREEKLWKASATARARRDLRTAAGAGDDGAINGNNNAAAHPPGGRTLEERVRERVLEEGPGAEALAAVGLVRDREEAFRLSGGGDGDGKGRSGGWRLPEDVVEEMRRDFRRKLDEECTQVLEQENKALLEARAGLAEREGTRTERELRELSNRLTNDGRDGLASLQRQLEKKEVERLAAEREQLKEALAHSLQEERERLVSERELKISEAQDASGRELSRLAEDLWEQAERSATNRREEAVRLLDQAAEDARIKLDALLTAHEQQGLDSLRQRSSLERKALVKRVREEGDRRYVEDLNALAESASKKNDAWVRMTVGDLTHSRQAAGARGGKDEGRQEGGLVSPALQLRAIEAFEDCSRLSRRLVELVMKEATMRLKDSLDSDLPEPNQEGRGANITSATGTNSSSSINDNNNFRTRVDNDGGGRGGDRCCQDCERLARANVQLSRLLLRTATAGTREEGRTSKNVVAKAGTAGKKGATGKKKVGHVATASNKRVTRTNPRGVVPVAKLNSPRRAGRK